MSSAFRAGGSSLAEVVERARARIGTEGGRRETVVEAGHLRRFCEAIGDANPRWQVEAPPTFLVAISSETLDLPEALAYGKGWLNGGDSFRHREAVRVGDTIAAVTRLVDVFEKQGATGAMLFLVSETTLTNQHGRVVATITGTRIRR